MGLFNILLAAAIVTYVSSQTMDVIVIGAGAAGLMAARELTNEGGFKVTVLEARARFGGRIWTNTETFNNATGPEVDMGASFIHHPDDDNSVVQLHREFQLPMLDIYGDPPQPVSMVVIREKDGSQYGQSRVMSAAAKTEQAFQIAMNYSMLNNMNMSLKGALWKSKQATGIGNPLSQLYVAFKEFNFGAPIDNVSAGLMDVGYKYASEMKEKLPAMGYGKLMDKLVQSNSSAEPLNIRLEQEVTQVEVLDNHKVSVTCKDGSTYECDAVIVTLPLGVLKANDVKFIPELSERKKKAIDRLGCGTVNKIILKFNKIFWDRDSNMIGIAVKNNSERGKLALFGNFYPASDQPILISYAVSHFGEASEKLSDKQLKRLALRRLRTIYGSTMDKVSVVKMARTRWRADPFSRGAYSFPAVGIRVDDWDRIGEASPPLFFAGEHTRTIQYGTVQTAIDTGRRAASETVQYLNNRAIPSSSKAHSISSSSNLLSLLSLIYLAFQYSR